MKKAILLFLGAATAISCGEDGDNRPQPATAAASALSSPGIPGMTYGPISRLVSLRFIRVRPSTGATQPIFVSRINTVVNAASNIYNTMGLKFFVQAIDDVVAPHLGPQPGYETLAWSDIWSELSQVLPVDANSYPSDTVMSPSAWLHRVSADHLSPLTVAVWVLPAPRKCSTDAECPDPGGGAVHTCFKSGTATTGICSPNPYVNQGTRPSGSPVANTIIVRKDVQDGERDNLAHELGHWLNLIHTDHSSASGTISYPTPPDPSDDPGNVCIYWDKYFIPAGATPAVGASNYYFSSRANCDGFLAANGLPRSVTRAMSLDSSAANRCSAACIADHVNGCGDQRAVCEYLADSATHKLGMRHYGEWYTSDNYQLGGVSSAKNGTYAYDVMAYAPISISEHMISPSQVEAIHKTFQFHERTPSSCAGQTEAGATNWVQHGSTGVYVDIDTSDCEFTQTPLYFASLGGSSHWVTRGASSIYSATPTGFRVYVKRPSGITVAQARSSNWQINWQANPAGLSHPAGTAAETLCTGESTRNWVQAGTDIVSLTVDTSACGFTSTPAYFTSLGGAGGHWDTRGATSIVSPTPTGFSVSVHQAGLTAASAANADWHINWKAILPGQQFAYTCTGQGIGGANANWVQYASDGIYVDVDTSACTEFAGSATAPLVFTSLQGDGSQSIVHGTTSIYSPTGTGFRVYLNKSNITAAFANSNAWTVNWSLHPRRELIPEIR